MNASLLEALKKMNGAPYQSAGHQTNQGKKLPLSDNKLTNDPLPFLTQLLLSVWLGYIWWEHTTTANNGQALTLFLNCSVCQSVSQSVCLFVCMYVFMYV